ncbi:hypothetical protein PUR61_12335 [Streptomyces sp. BE20]|uniref:DUF6895 family protein n=1 Tax=unclassified Streptomyces TaxID=2593676 RepID=UPI002E763520|nr:MULTISPECIES: hypothetical protein [unclassified Streptomyces]MED7948862.1 hypothetical protein [Streptomyces sp. BE303]MEE1822972.1 hypothetical protein [Streptomyces sp. BE20]
MISTDVSTFATTSATGPAQTCTDRLRERIRTCLDWGTRALTIGHGAAPLWETDEAEVIQPFEKMLIEAALFALIAHRAVGDDPALSRLLDAITDCTDSLDHIYELVRWQPYLWSSAGAIWVILDRFGRGDAAKRARLRTLWCEEQIPHPRERVPYRLLDQAWVRTIAEGKRDPRLSSAGLRSCTSFENVRGALFMATGDLYALTHTAMYVTDFGRAGRVSADQEWIDALCACRLLLNDLDLAGELALTDALTSDRPREGTLTALAALSSIFDRLGFVPSPTFRDAEHRRAPDPTNYLLFHSYHSTFVYGLLCSVLAVTGGDRGDVARIMSKPKELRFPEEWCGRRAGETHLSSQVAHTFNAWAGITAARGVDLDHDALLRVVIDSYLITAASEERTEDLLSLLGMRAVAGPSVVDHETRRLLVRRARLGGDDSLAALLTPQEVPWTSAR